MSFLDLNDDVKSITAKHLSNDYKIRIGCKIMTIEEWDNWFSSTEEFETKRCIPQFIRIQANYLAVKTYVEFLKVA
jgi:hypothetical protein